MKIKFIILAALAAAACESKQNVQCEINTDCDLSGGGVCTLNSASGNHWCAYPDPLCPSGYRYSDTSVGDGLAGECVPETAVPIDGGVDAPPDGGTVVSGQYADLVIGQDNFTSSIANSGGQSASSINGPTSVTSDGTHLWIADAKNARVVQFDTLPVVNRPLASIVVGQAGFTSSTSSTSQTTIRIGDVNMFAAGGKLFVADGSSNRVLIFNSIPTQSGAVASVVLGQGDFTTSTTGKAATSLYGPTDVWSDGTRLVVVDNANSRVLIWNAIPTSNGQAANTVIGRSAFGLGLGDAPADPPSSASMKFPTGVWSNGTRLYVGDAGNQRVMVWNQFPTSNGAPCDFVLGQTSFTANTANAGGANANAIGLDRPYKAIEVGGSLFVADSINHRVVVHSPIPSTSGEAADAVLGQDNLDSNVLPNTPTGNSMSSPRWIGIAGGALYVPDYDWNRVTRFQLN